jgi:microcystin-dependent protein
MPRSGPQPRRAISRPGHYHRPEPAAHPRRGDHERAIPQRDPHVRVRLPAARLGLLRRQILSIAQNTALFALLGTTYGGNGTTVFALPDLRGRTPLHFGQGPGLQQRSLGELGGEENQTLQAAQLPMHGHGLTAAAAASVGAPDGARLAAGELPAFRESVSTTVPMAADAIGPAGGGQPHPNMQPSLGINFSIALEGVFPSRD